MLRALFLIAALGACKKSGPPAKPAPAVSAPQVGRFVITSGTRKLDLPVAEYQSLMASAPNDWYPLEKVLAKVMPGARFSSVEIRITGGATRVVPRAELARCTVKLNRRGEFRFQLVEKQPGPSLGNFTIDELLLKPGD
jgi:hypothetical protein